MSQNERNARHIRNYLEEGLERIDQGVTIFDGELRLVFANESLLDIFDVTEDVIYPGVTLEEILRFNAMRGEYGDGDIEAIVSEKLARAWRFETHTIERVRPNGAVLRISGWPLPSGGFASIYTDLTEQRHREAQLEQTVLNRTEELRNNEARLRLIANEVPAGIAYLDRDEIFQFANMRFASAYGLNTENIVGRRSQDILSAELMAVAQPYFDRARAGAAIAFDHEAALADGRRLDVRSFLRPERQPEDGPRGFYVLSLYIGRQKRAERTLLQVKKMEALDQLSSGIAHDFNNLLTVIIGNLTPLYDRIADEEVRRTMLEPALRAAQRGAELTRRLLATARRQPLEPRPTDVADAARMLSTLIRPSLPAGVALDIETPPDPMLSFIDQAQLENALLNLSINARDAVGDQGRIVFRVSGRDLSQTEAEEIGVTPGAYIEVACVDDGVGIDPTAIDRVFEPFFSTKSETGGSGLGLAIVYAFARESGGGITVHSEPGAGSAIRLFLPLSIGRGAAASGTRNDGAADDPVGVSFDGVLILLVDDNDAVRAVMRRELVERGFAIVEAANGREALDLADSLPELGMVLSDIAMPGDVSGLDLAAELAGKRPDLPVVLMTGHGVERFEGAADAARPTILRKPIQNGALVRALAKALTTRRGDAAAVS